MLPDMKSNAFYGIAQIIPMEKLGFNEERKYLFWSSNFTKQKGSN